MSISALCYSSIVCHGRCRWRLLSNARALLLVLLVVLASTVVWPSSCLLVAVSRHRELAVFTAQCERDRRRASFFGVRVTTSTVHMWSEQMHMHSSRSHRPKWLSRKEDHRPHRRIHSSTAPTFVHECYDNIHFIHYYFYLLPVFSTSALLAAWRQLFITLSAYAELPSILVLLLCR